MIVIGSVAAQRREIVIPGKPADVDIVGTRDELARFREENKAFITGEQHVHDHRAHFSLGPGLEWNCVEFDYEESASDRMLAQLSATQTTQILNSQIQLPGANLLYLTKRAHANVALNFAKTILHMKILKSHVTEFSAAETTYYETRKSECLGRLRKHPARFKLDVSNDEFFAISNHIRTYEHDDLHKAIAFTKGHPLYERCKRDLNSARIEQDMFLELSPDDRIRMLQEEIMVVGIERFYLHNRSLPLQQAYWTGMLKTLRDLFTGWFQDYSLDHVDRLATASPYDFIERFEAAERNNELRLLAKDCDGPENEIDVAIRLFSANRLQEADERFRALLNQPPEGNTQALLFLGRIARKRRQNEIASYYFRKAVQADAKLFEGWNELGNALHATGRSEEAMECYRKTIQLRPAFAPAYVNLGFVLEACGHAETALETYREGLRRKGDDQVLQQCLQKLVAAQGARVAEA